MLPSSAPQAYCLPDPLAAVPWAPCPSPSPLPLWLAPPVQLDTLVDFEPYMEQHSRQKGSKVGCAARVPSMVKPSRMLHSACRSVLPRHPVLSRAEDMARGR